jgi:hypothetical protein
VQEGEDHETFCHRIYPDSIAVCYGSLYRSARGRYSAVQRRSEGTVSHCFNAEAAKFEAEAVEHETLANSYRGKGDSVGAKGPMTGRTAGHCDYFAKVAREKAKANRELATQHELMAKDAEK